MRDESSDAHRFLVRALAVGALVVLGSCNAWSVRDGQVGRDRPARDVPRYDVETFYDTRLIFGSTFSADETRILVSSDETGVFNCYSVDIESGEQTRLTDSTTEAYFAVSWFPRDDRFLFSADQAGNELTHLFARHPDGAIVDLTPGDNLKARFAGWSGDDRHLWVLTNERDPQFFDLYRYAVPPLGAGGSSENAPRYDRELVFENTGGYTVEGVSLDSRWVSLNKTNTNTDNDLFVWDAREPGAAPRHVTPHEGDVAHAFASFSPDSKTLYYLSNADSEFDRAWSYDLASGDRALEREADWDVVDLRFSRDGRYRVSAINADARTEVEVLDRRTGEPVELPDLPAGSIRGIHVARSSRSMAFYLGSDTSPRDLYVVDLESRAHRRLTSTLSSKIDESHLVASQVVRYPSFDGLQVPALLYRPHQASATRKVPALVWVHGGPGGQSVVRYDEDLQYLVNHGYAVLAVNNRGSSGYGKTFYHLDDRRHGEDDLADCVAGRRYLESLDWVDAEKIGIFGGSYGGYMVVAALAFQPRVFDVGIDVFGITNWVRTLESIPPWWASFRDYLYAELGDPAADRERLFRISPLFHADRIEKPLLVIQGANDPRVLKVESDEIVAALEKRGVPVEYLVFDDEGHGFRHKKNRIKCARVMLTFLDRHLRGPITDAGEPRYSSGETASGK